MSDPLEAKRSECRCYRCVSACYRFPGWFEPGQAERVAEHLGTTVEDLFRSRLIVDYWCDGCRDDIYVLAPSNQRNEPGEVVPFLKPDGRCTFLTDDNRCEIHEVKPTECAIDHHEMSDEDYYRWRAANAESWRAHRESIIQLLGKHPEPPSNAERVIGALGILARAIEEHAEVEEDKEA